MSFSQSRRRLGFSLTCSLVALAGISSLALPAFAEEKGVSRDPSSKVRVEWQVTKDQADDVKKVLPLTQTATSNTSNQLVAASILVGAAFIPELAQAVIDVYYRYKNGGVIIDARGEPIIVQTSDRVALGHAVIITVNESKLVQIGGTDKVTLDVLSDLLSAAVKK
jgi:hypothetical protein